MFYVGVLLTLLNYHKKLDRLKLGTYSNIKHPDVHEWLKKCERPPELFK